MLKVGDACYLMCRGSRMMPGTVVDITVENGVALASVRSPNGKIYTTVASRLLSTSEGRVGKSWERANRLVDDGYMILVAAPGRFHVLNPKKHGENGGYDLTDDTQEGLTCTCPSYAAVGTCKHCMAFGDLIRSRATHALESGMPDAAAWYLSHLMA